MNKRVNIRIALQSQLYAALKFWFLPGEVRNQGLKSCSGNQQIVFLYPILNKHYET